MSKKTKIGLLSLLILIALYYIFSPPKNLSIQINASPEGAQEFYVRTVSSRPGLHGRDFKNLGIHLIPANQNISIPLNQDKILWFGRIFLYIYHPEYFNNNAETNNRFILPSATFSPTTWQNIISSEEKVVSQQVYRPDALAYRDIPISHLNYHLYYVNANIIDLYLKEHDKDLMRKSVGVLTTNTDLFIKGMLEENVGEYGETKEMKDEIGKAHNLINEIHHKIN